MASYDDPSFHVRREIQLPTVTLVSSASAAKFLQFLATKLKAVHAQVLTAGTNAAAALDVYVGTASVGTLVFGTNTAGVVVHSATLNAAVPANSIIELKAKATSEAVLAVSIEHEPVWDAAITA